MRWLMTPLGEDEEPLLVLVVSHADQEEIRPVRTLKNEGMVNFNPVNRPIRYM